MQTISVLEVNNITPQRNCGNTIYRGSTGQDSWTAGFSRKDGFFLGLKDLHERFTAMEQIKIQMINNRLSSPIKRLEKLNSVNDLKTEELLQAGANTPLGQLLDKVSKLPEVRFEKISTVRRQICLGKYQLDEKLDVTIDRILEELIVEP